MPRAAQASPSDAPPSPTAPAGLVQSPKPPTSGTTRPNATCRRAPLPGLATTPPATRDHGRPVLAAHVARAATASGRVGKVSGTRSGPGSRLVGERWWRALTGRCGSQASAVGARRRCARYAAARCRRSLGRSGPPCRSAPRPRRRPSGQLTGGEWTSERPNARCQSRWCVTLRTLVDCEVGRRHAGGGRACRRPLRHLARPSPAR